MRVTFDTNVWNRMVFPERATGTKRAVFGRLASEIRCARIKGFICESFATVEAVDRSERAKIFLQNVPKVNVSSAPFGSTCLGMSINIEARHEAHPGLGPYFEEELEAALAIGVKLLSTPWIGIAIPPRLLDHPEIYAPEVFATSDYNERFGEVAGKITARGVGGGALPALIAELITRLDGPRPSGVSDRDLIYRVYEYARTHGLKPERKLIEDAFSESSDGDLVAAHIASGNDYLCTEDRGRSNSMDSIFSESNRKWLASAFGVKIVTAQELVGLL